MVALQPWSFLSPQMFFLLAFWKCCLQIFEEIMAVEKGLRWIFRLLHRDSCLRLSTERPCGRSVKAGGCWVVPLPARCGLLALGSGHRSCTPLPALKASPLAARSPQLPTVGFAWRYRAAYTVHRVHASTSASLVLCILWSSCPGCPAGLCPWLAVCSTGLVLESWPSVDQTLDGEVSKSGTCSLRKTRKYTFNQDGRIKSVP